MARENIDRLLSMMDQAAGPNYGARGDADAGSRANLDKLMGQGRSVLDIESETNSRRERLARIRANRAAGPRDMAAQATPQRAASSALARVPTAAVPASQVQYIPPTATSGRTFAMPAAGAARAAGPFPMGGIPQQAIAQGMGGGGLANLNPIAMGGADDAMRAMAAQAGPTALGPINYTRTAAAAAQASAPSMAQLAAGSVDDVARAAGAGGTRAATTGASAAAGAAASSVDDLARMAAQSAGLIDDVPSAFVGRPTLGAAAGAADDVAKAAAKPGMMGRLGTAARMAGPPILGYMGGQMVGGLVDSANVGGDNSAQDRFLRNAAVGAGLGAGIGSIIPGVGTAIGAVGGGLLGGLGAGFLGVKFGDSDTAADVATRFQGALSQSGLSPEMQQAVMSQYVLQTQNMGASQARQVAEMLSQQASAMVLGEAQQREQQQRAMALQSMMAPLFQPYLDLAANAARSNTLALNTAADTLTDPQMAALYRARASNLENMAMQGVAGYATQMANPALARDLAMLQQYGSRVDSSILGTLAGQAGQAAVGVGGAPGQNTLADIVLNGQRAQG